MARPVRPLPVFLNLLRIRFPVGAIASIAHRVAGVLLFLALPPLALGLDASLRSEAGFEAMRDLLSSPWRALVGLILVWAAAHHLLAGIRHLLMDVGIGGGLAQARASARAVLVVAVLLALVFAAGWLT
ncbi:succinate dehydrogenase, cytochrome b556 subunit [Thauera phenolivorans]|uniref:succinate dehydrogenase, cytochrome b556 subunit n=1 Tax=Thauera phenolivorans TaxID=1792543 RepID=UPI00083B679E|nr:succinate dehydrogenase, cytochrome b556 subunit [Thauera phenolivorans]